MKQSLVYERAEAMVMQDKFNYRKTEFFNELNKLVGRYMEYDSMTVETHCGTNSNLIITISVKKVKPSARPLA